jgi:hypothetical protein
MGWSSSIQHVADRLNLPACLCNDSRGRALENLLDQSTNRSTQRSRHCPPFFPRSNCCGFAFTTSQANVPHGPSSRNSNSNGPSPKNGGPQRGFQSHADAAPPNGRHVHFSWIGISGQLSGLGQANYPGWSWVFRGCLACLISPALGSLRIPPYPPPPLTSFKSSLRRGRACLLGEEGGGIIISFIFSRPEYMQDDLTLDDRLSVRVSNGSKCPIRGINRPCLPTCLPSRGSKPAAASHFCC